VENVARGKVVSVGIKWEERRGLKVVPGILVSSVERKNERTGRHPNGSKGLDRGRGEGGRRGGNEDATPRKRGH